MGSLPDAELAEDPAQKVFGVDGADELAQSVEGEPQFHRDQFRGLASLGQFGRRPGMAIRRRH